MKSGSILVNISRGAIVDTNALIGVLEQGHLSGAVLDVTEEEPLSENSELWNMENVILTPHNSFVGNQNDVQLLKQVLRNLGR